MNPERFLSLTQNYPKLRVAIVGDFCLDRYLEIDPARQEISIETGLPVHNVVNIRSQPGGAGTILNNLEALGVGEIHAVGICGEDGEGYELRRALAAKPSVRLDHFIQTPLRRTFTYTKPLVVAPGTTPVELNRLDCKNWTPTPASLEQQISRAVLKLAEQVDAIIILDQVDVANTGVVTTNVLATVAEAANCFPTLLMLADSRRGLGDFPAVTLKMNRTELGVMMNAKHTLTLEEAKSLAHELAWKKTRPVFVSLAENGIIGAMPEGEVAHVPAIPVRGEIDVVGAGDSVTANLAAALAAGAHLREALEMANAAASIVVHQMGTTGTASVKQIGGLLLNLAPHRAG